MRIVTKRPWNSMAWDGVVFLASLVVIALQIVLMQAVSQIQGHHFAYVVISIALLGFGCSGTVIALAERWMRRRTDRLVPAFLLLTALSCLTVFPPAFHMAAGTDIHLLLVDMSEWPALLAAGGLAFLPFFLLAMVLGLVFIRDTETIGRRYGANLVGSACGGGLALVLLLFFHPEETLPLFCCLTAAGAVIPPVTEKRNRSKRIYAALSSVLFLAGLAVCANAPPLPLSPYKDLSYAARLPGTVITEDRSHPMGRVQVARSPSLRYGKGLSLSYRGDLPDTPRVYINGDEYGVVLSSEKGDSHILDYSVQTLPLSLRLPERALVLDAGAVASLSHLLHHGVPSVDAVEPHPEVADLLEITHEEDVRNGRFSVRIMDSRSFLSERESRYDLVLLPIQGTFGGSVGLQALQENYLLTREAFRAAWEALDDKGILSVSLYVDYPPRLSLKLISLLAETISEAGIDDPSSHLAALRNWDLVTIAVSPSPLGEEARSRLAELAETHGFDRAWVPGAGPHPGDRRHLVEDDLFAEAMTALLEKRREWTAGAYPFMISAPTDDRPFFYQTLHLGQLEEARRALGGGSLAYTEMGVILLALTTGILAVAAFLLILAPLLKLRGKAGMESAPTLFYFAALGLGFMFLEILWIQRFILYWGHPLYSAAGVISALLVGMGLGSMATSGMPARGTVIPLAAALVCVVLVLSIALLTPLFEATLSFPGPVRYCLGLAAIAAPSFLMGMPFPLALRRLGRVNPHLTAWAWGINGCFSVLGAPLAALAAMQFGFTVLGWGVVAAYLAAFVSALPGTLSNR